MKESTCIRNLHGSAFLFWFSSCVKSRKTSNCSLIQLKPLFCWNVPWCHLHSLSWHPDWHYLLAVKTSLTLLERTITSDCRFTLMFSFWVWWRARWEKSEWQCARCEEKQSPGMTSQWTGSFIAWRVWPQVQTVLPNKGHFLLANHTFCKIIHALFTYRKTDYKAVD